MVNSDGEIEFANPRAEEILGLEASDIEGRSYDDPRWKITDYDGEEFPQDRLPFAQVMESKEPVYDVRHAIEWPDGGRKLLSINGAPVLDRDGDVKSVVFAIEDVTDKVKAEDALRRSEERYRRLFERNQAAVFRSTVDGQLLEFNRSFADLFGLSLEDSGDPALSVLDLYDVPEDREPFTQALLEEGFVDRMPLRMSTLDGEPLWVLTSSVLLEDDGEDGEIQGTIIDITEQRRADQRLAESERRFKALVQNASDLITLLDPDGHVLYQSPSIQEVLGYEPYEIEGQNIRDLVHEADHDLYRETLQQIMRETDEVVGAELRVKHSDGSTHYLELRGRNLLDDPAVEAIVVNSRDVTERRRHSYEQEAVLRVAAALRAAQSRDEMPPIILEELEELLQSDSVALVKYDENADEMVIEQAVGPWREMEQRRLSRGEGLSWKVYDQAQPLLVPSLREDGVFEDSKYAVDEYAGLGVPLIVHESVFGVLWLARRTEFEPEEVGIAAAVADMAANGLHRAALHEETERKADQMATVSKLGQTLGQALDKGFVYERLVNAVLELMPDLNTVLISRFNPEEKEFTLVHGIDAGEEIDPTDVPPVALEDPGSGGQSEVIHSGEPFIVNDLNELYEIRPDSRMGEPPFTQSALYVPLVSKGQILGVLQAQSLSKGRFDGTDAEVMMLVANTAAVALTNAEMFHEIQTSNVQLSLAYDTTLEGWAKALELRDQETEGHTRRVTDMTVRLALELDVPPNELVDIRRGALLHDIGKMGIPDEILFKPGSLNDEEWEVMKRHPVYAKDLLAGVDYVAEALDIPYYHHERWDGSGYPEGLQGEEIPLPARIFAVIDVYDALCSDRPYRDAWPREKAIDYLNENAGVLFDPDVVAAFLRMNEN